MKLACIAAFVTVAIATSGCVSGMGRMIEYGSRLPDAKTKVGRDSFSIWVHPKESDLLIQKGIGAAMGQGLLEGASLGIAHLEARKPIWIAAADWLLKPAGCAATDAYSIDNRVTWEATYTCPPGINLRTLVAEHRSTLRQGIPLAPMSH